MSVMLPAWGKTPNQKLRLFRAIHGDWPIGHRNVAANRVYETHEICLNPHGAVSVLGSDGWLGVKPEEMEWLPE